MKYLCIVFILRGIICSKFFAAVNIHNKWTLRLAIFCHIIALHIKPCLVLISLKITFHSDEGPSFQVSVSLLYIFLGSTQPFCCFYLIYNCLHSTAFIVFIQ